MGRHKENELEDIKGDTISSDDRVVSTIGNNNKAGKSVCIWQIPGGQLFRTVRDMVTDGVFDDGGLDVVQLEGRDLRFKPNLDLHDLIPVCDGESNASGRNGVVIVYEATMLSPEVLNALVNFAAYGSFADMNMCPGWTFAFLCNSGETGDAVWDSLDFKCISHIKAFDYNPSSYYQSDEDDVRENKRKRKVLANTEEFDGFFGGRSDESYTRRTRGTRINESRGVRNRRENMHMLSESDIARIVRNCLNTLDEGESSKRNTIAGIRRRISESEHSRFDRCFDVERERRGVNESSRPVFRRKRTII